MRILVDLQACQTSSRNRGIGRYALSLAQAMARQAGDHKIWIALNGRLPGTIRQVRAAFDGLVRQDCILVAYLPPRPPSRHPSDAWWSPASKGIWETFLSKAKPDMLHVASVFEGLADSAITSINVPFSGCGSAATLYDLIPYLRQDDYLSDTQTRDWYLSKVKTVSQSDLLLAISEHTRREAIQHLGVQEDRVVNISAAVDRKFRLREGSPGLSKQVAELHGLQKPFLMYTGGHEQRKNLEGLIEAFARLPEDLRQGYQLAIVCQIDDGGRLALRQRVSASGLDDQDVVFTGFVPDEQLVDLYNACALFVFPSFEEGFGLPVLEAMSCGAPVIGSDSTSIPEVIGRSDVLFDPSDSNAMAAKIAEVLTNEGLLSELRTYGLKRAEHFSWDATGRRALEAMERALSLRARPTSGTVQRPTHVRERLAFVSPLPPDRSGISDYSADLLPALAEHYDIEVITQSGSTTDPWVKGHLPQHDPTWFEANAHRFGHVIYQFGNSVFHKHMFGLLERHPGMVVLHDFYLGHLLRHLDASGFSNNMLEGELYRSHGYPALLLAKPSQEAAADQYPCSGRIFWDATGVVVHSQLALDLAKSWYGLDTDDRVRRIPLIRTAPPTLDRAAARRRLGLGDNDFLLCSFGILAETKLDDRLIRAFFASPVAADPRTRLVFVGECPSPAYHKALTDLVSGSDGGNRVTITGHMDQDTYRTYLEAADAAIQLRAQSRGETSLSLLDCLAHGLPTIANAHGSTREVPSDTLLSIRDDFEDTDLGNAMARIRTDGPLRGYLSRAGRAHVQERHSPSLVAGLYRDALEAFAREGHRVPYDALIESLSRLSIPRRSRKRILLDLANSVASSITDHPKQLLVDVTRLSPGESHHHSLALRLLRRLIEQPPERLRVEPVVLDSSGHYRYARRFVTALEGLEPGLLHDDLMETASGDTLLVLGIAQGSLPDASELEVLRDAGVSVWILLPDGRSSTTLISSLGSTVDGMICLSKRSADQLLASLDRMVMSRERALQIGHLGLSDEGWGALDENGTIRRLASLVRGENTYNIRPCPSPASADDMDLRTQEAGEDSNRHRIWNSRAGLGEIMRVGFYDFDWPLSRPVRIGVAVDTQDSFVEMIRSNPPTDPTVDLMAHFVGRGNKFIDLGANLGYYSLPLANMGARVLAVEALPKNAAVLTSSIVENGFRNITLVHAAVFDQTGVVRVGGTSAWGQIQTRPEGYEVPSITLDDLTAAYDFRDASAVKMDVEGAELAVLRGGRIFFSDKPDLVVLFEANHFACAQLGYHPAELLLAFEELGYVLYLIEGRTLIPRCSSDFMEATVADYLAVRQGRELEIPGREVRSLTIDERAELVVRGLTPASEENAQHRARLRVHEASIPAELSAHPRVVSLMSELRQADDEAFTAAVAVFAALVSPGPPRETTH